MRPCAEWHLLIQADIDGELDAASAIEVATHLQGCAGCRAVQAGLVGVSRQVRREATRHVAPSLPRARVVTRRRAAAGAGLALAAMALLFAAPRDDVVLADLVDSHVRALQPGHLMDVVSTDQHTVKPWFDGRLDYAPPVRDFAAAGFPLTGGRLDVLRGRPVAVLVYRRRQHVIDVFVWPEEQRARAAGGVRSGYGVVTWRQEAMAFAAVSDLASEELRAFAALWQRG